MFNKKKTAVLRVSWLTSRLENVKIKSVPTNIGLNNINNKFSAIYASVHRKRVFVPQSSKQSTCGALLASE